MDLFHIPIRQILEGRVQYLGRFVGSLRQILGQFVDELLLGNLLFLGVHLAGGGARERENSLIDCIGWDCKVGFLSDSIRPECRV